MLKRTIQSQVASIAPRGFTLLEVLMALGLSVMLLTAVYSALDLHYRYSTAGREDMERAQIARALFQRMTADIRSVVYRTEEQNAGGQDAAADAEDDFGTTTITFDLTESADTYTQGSIGVFGDMGTLVLHISQPIRSIGIGTSAEAVMSYGGDLQSVAYFLAGADGGALQELVATQVNELGVEVSEGLARMQGDRLSMNLADESGDLQSLASQAQILAEEINHLEFHYFDGVEWLDEWDSDASGGLPLAIEITIGFRPPADTENPLVRRYASASTEGFRLVVALPMANASEVAAGL